jgi:hypothetical protein
MLSRVWTELTEGLAMSQPLYVKMPTPSQRYDGNGVKPALATGLKCQVVGSVKLMMSVLI